MQQVVDIVNRKPFWFRVLVCFLLLALVIFPYQQQKAQAVVPALAAVAVPALEALGCGLAALGITTALNDGEFDFKAYVQTVYDAYLLQHPGAATIDALVHMGTESYLSGDLMEWLREYTLSDYPCTSVYSPDYTVSDFSTQPKMSFFMAKALFLSCYPSLTAAVNKALSEYPELSSDKYGSVGFVYGGSNFIIYRCLSSSPITAESGYIRIGGTFMGQFSKNGSVLSAPQSGMVMGIFGLAANGLLIGMFGSNDYGCVFSGYSGIPANVADLGTTLDNPLQPDYIKNWVGQSYTVDSAAAIEGVLPGTYIPVGVATDGKVTEEPDTDGVRTGAVPIPIPGDTTLPDNPAADDPETGSDAESGSGTGISGVLDWLAKIWGLLSPLGRLITICQMLQDYLPKLLPLDYTNPLNAIRDAILDIPLVDAIVSALSGSWEKLWEMLQGLLDGILSIPASIAQYIKDVLIDLFYPTQALEGIDNMKNTLLGKFSVGFFESFVNSMQNTDVTSLDDIYIDAFTNHELGIAPVHKRIVCWAELFTQERLNTFHNITRGLFYPLLIFYNFDQLYFAVTKSRFAFGFTRVIGNDAQGSKNSGKSS